MGIRQCGARSAARSAAQTAAQTACRIERELAFDKRTWFIGEVVATRRHAEHRGAEVLMCGRHDYRLPGAVVSER